MTTVSVIVPSVGRRSLARTLASITCWPGDEILVIGTWPSGVPRDPRARFLPCIAGQDTGATERRLGMTAARGDYLVFLDDDDTHYRTTRAVLAAVMTDAADRVTVCRVRYPSGRTIWIDPVLRFGNVSGQMVVAPNDPARLGQWTSRYGQDFDFLATMAFDGLVWNRHVIACLGHEPAVQVAR